MHFQHNEQHIQNGTILALVTCNQLVSLFFSGRWHKQYILNEVIIALYNVFLVLTEGNTVNSVFYNQERKDGLVYRPSYCILTGYSPCHSV